jgi:hypothetical protein
VTALAPLLQAFFTDRLIAQRRASGHTIVGYRNTNSGCCSPSLPRRPAKGRPRWTSRSWMRR